MLDALKFLIGLGGAVMALWALGFMAMFLAQESTLWPILICVLIYLPLIIWRMSTLRRYRDNTLQLGLSLGVLIGGLLGGLCAVMGFSLR